MPYFYYDKKEVLFMWNLINDLYTSCIKVAVEIR